MTVNATIPPFTIGLITLFPQMFDALKESITGKALQKKLLELQFWNPRDYTHDKHLAVDDKPYGGGPGMVMMVQPIRDAIHAAKKTLGQHTKVIYLSPQGKKIQQKHIIEMTKQKCFIMIAGRYEGIDQRIIEHDIDEEWSIGDYVLTGGELAAMVIIDACTRLLPGVLGDASSANHESFMQGMHGLLDYPHYTRPDNCEGQTVPSVLREGNHAAILRWRMKQSLGNTWLKRPDLLLSTSLTEEQQQLLNEFKCEYEKRKTHHGKIKDEHY